MIIENKAYIVKSNDSSLWVGHKFFKESENRFFEVCEIGKTRKEVKDKLSRYNSKQEWQLLNNNK